MTRLNFVTANKHTSHASQPHSRRGEQLVTTLPHGPARPRASSSHRCRAGVMTSCGGSAIQCLHPHTTQYWCACRSDDSELLSCTEQVRRHLPWFLHLWCADVDRFGRGFWAAALAS